MLEYTVNGLVRHAFGFANPNHAAAAICALFPFCWGWRGAWRWAGRLGGVALCIMLAMTYSRTGVALMAIEAIAMSELKVESVKCKALRWLCLLSAALLVMGFALWWMWPRIALDGAILNRPRIWLAGLRLFAANPLGVGWGNSGALATAFMLPDGVAVRTLVNSHLTLLAEAGAFVGGAWLAFIALALCAGRKMRRTWVAFAGLALSASASSVFDWHVLFDFAGKGGCGVVNFALAWGLFVSFVVMGAAMIASGVFGDDKDSLKQHVCGRRMAGLRKVVARAGLAFALVFAVLCASALLMRTGAAPKVEGEFAVVGKGAARVYRDAGWSIGAVRRYFPGGARYRLDPFVPDGAAAAGDVWLFGDVAESAWRFPDARITLVAPPEFCERPANVVRVISSGEAPE